MQSSFVRGSQITFRATCLDATGNPFTPTEATLSISYVTANGQRDHATISMTIAGGAASRVWDSSVASDAMPVHWHIRASSPTEKVAQDGTFRLVAAEANPAPTQPDPAAPLS